MRVLREFTRAASTTAIRSANANAASTRALADKFNLATLNGGKSPFEVSSQRLMSAGAPKKTTKTVAKPKAKKANSVKAQNDVRDIYSLEYLSGTKKAPKAKSNPFDVASSKLM
ncbi:TPA: hypothetical protein N0F65_009985 [Lagenidium giganteum]|uniref:Uncharacterized protein n=1 Tax=Lagenidium giganteum TaxID=4803 RepID=A0AAV2ZER9_9STRA|nr:TPA: hypothetical protein N0F65_009985 [Lagenidium giganteum]